VNRIGSAHRARVATLKLQHLADGGAINAHRHSHSRPRLATSATQHSPKKPRQRSGLVFDGALTVPLFITSALPRSNDAQWNTTLVLEHGLYEKLTLVCVQYSHCGAKTTLLCTGYFGKCSNYVWALDVKFRALKYRAIMNDFYGYCRATAPQYPAGDADRIAVDPTSCLWNLDIASVKLLGIQFG
jgi:hypothetical protein